MACMRVRSPWLRLDTAWTFQARTALAMISPREGAIVDAAVIAYAERGEGDMRHEPPYDILGAGVYDVEVAIDRRANTIAVLRFYRARAY
jgi:hypothetical protein